MRKKSLTWTDNPLSYFLFQPMLYNWCNIGHGMYYPVLYDGVYKRSLADNKKKNSLCCDCSRFLLCGPLSYDQSHINWPLVTIDYTTAPLHTRNK